MAEIKLSDAQKARMERNRQRALMLRNARLSSRPYPETKSQDSNREIRIGSSNSTTSRVIDTGGGFLLDPEDEETLNEVAKDLVEEPAPVLGGHQLHCCECQKEFLTSYLYKHFEVLVCDNCRDHEGKHTLITKTEAKEQFLLKDCDFDRRQPPLKFILKKNPHSSRGEMKLYLKSQESRNTWKQPFTASGSILLSMPAVRSKTLGDRAFMVAAPRFWNSLPKELREITNVNSFILVVQRSYEVWGGKEGLEEAREDKAEKREVQKQRRFDKKVKELRRAVRTSTWKKDTSRHEHKFPEAGEEGGEIYDEEADMWTKTCKTCGYQLTYEKM